MEGLMPIGLAVVTALVLVVLWELWPERRVRRAGGAPQGVPADSGDYRVLGHLSRLHVLHVDRSGRQYGIEDHHLFVSEDGGKSFHRRGSLPPASPGLIGRLKDLVLRSKLLRRIRQNRGPTTIEVLPSGTILVFWGRIFRSADGGRSFEAVSDPGAAGLVAGPFEFGVGTAAGPDGTVYLAEYTTQQRPHPVTILRGSNDGRDWDVAHRFEAGEIFHVHSITYDPYRDGFWVCTGDYDSETALLYTDDDFQSLRKEGGGSQDWRIVSLIVTRNYLYWGSDNDREEGASIFRWDLERKQLEKQQHIGKVSYYATRLLDGSLAISTTYEQNSPYTKANAPRASSELWLSRDGEHWQRVLDVPEAGLQLPWGPARAQIAFPAGAPLDRLYLLPRFTVGNPFQTLVIELPSLEPDARRRRRVA